MPDLINPAALKNDQALFKLGEIRRQVHDAQRQVALAQLLRNQKALQEQAQAAAESAQLNNQAGQASSEHVLDSDGVGSIDVAEPVTFGVPFRNEPFFLSSAAMVSKLGSAPMPRGQATVRSWVLDELGNYTGAYLTLWVGPDQAIKTTTTTTTTSTDPAVDPVVTEEVKDNSDEVKKYGFIMKHYLSFSGLAYKKLDDQVMDDMAATKLKSTPMGD